MEQTKTPLPPLVSDEQITTDAERKCKSNFGRGLSIDLSAQRMTGYTTGALDVRDIYEQDRAKTREVVQALVDDAHRYMETCPADADLTSAFYSAGLSLHTSLTLAKSRLQIEPSKP